MNEGAMNDDEQFMVLELAEGNRDEAKEVVRGILDEYGPQILGIINAELKNRSVPGNRKEIAKDILQETCVQLIVCAREGKLKEARSLKSYVFGIANKVCLNALRYEGSRKTVSFTDEECTGGLENLPDKIGYNRAEYEELRAALFECIDQLPPLQKKYITDIAADPYDPLTPKDLSDMYDVPANSISNRLFEARRGIDECMTLKKFPLPHLNN